MLATFVITIYQILRKNSNSQGRNTPPNHLALESAEIIHFSSDSEKEWYTRHTKILIIAFCLAKTDKSARANADMKFIDRTMWMLRGGGGGTRSSELVPLKKGYI